MNHFTNDELIQARSGKTVCRSTENRFYYLSFYPWLGDDAFLVKVYTRGPVVGKFETDGYLCAEITADEANTLLLTLV